MKINELVPFAQSLGEGLRFGAERWLGRGRLRGLPGKNEI